MKRALRLVAVLAIAWLAVLFVLGFVLAGRAADKVSARLAQSLQAPTTIRDRSLGLVRGNFAFEGLAAKRDDAVGKLALTVGAVDCDLPPLGLALVDRTCSELVVRDVALELSTIAMFQLQRPRHTSLSADRVIVDRADLVFQPSAFLPGLGRIRIVIEHAEAGATTFKSPLSWLFHLEALRASVELPGGITLGVGYADGKLVARGSVLGSVPVTIPVALPVPDSADDAQTELRKLVAFVKDVAQKIVAQKAEDWLRNKLP